jgi:hypothetical protein
MRIRILAFRLTTERFFYGRRFMDKGDGNLKNGRFQIIIIFIKNKYKYVDY